MIEVIVFGVVGLVVVGFVLPAMILLGLEMWRDLADEFRGWRSDRRRRPL